LQADQLEAAELDSALDADCGEAEVLQEVARKDGAMDEEPLARTGVFPVAVGECLEGVCALVTRLPDRSQEQRLLHPLGRVAGEVCARDEHGVITRRARRQIGRPWEERGRTVLHGADHAPVVVAVDRPPLAPLVLGAVDPTLLGRGPVPARLPPYAILADTGHGGECPPGQALDPRGHQAAGTGGGPISSTTTSIEAGTTSAIRLR
jgi:hypothetical protein